MSKSSRDNRTPLICFLFSLAVVSAYILEIRGHAFSLLKHTFESYIYYAAGTDMASYFDNAEKFFHGQWPVGPFYRAPLYSFFIIFMSLFTDKVICVIIIQILLLSGAIYFSYLTAAEVFGRKAAIITSIILTLYGGFVFWAAIPHTTVIEITLSVLSFYTLVMLRKMFNYNKICIAGICGAMLCLIRPNFLVIIPPAMFFIAIEQMIRRKNLEFSPSSASRASSAPGVAHPVRILLFGILCFILPLLPLIIWNNLHSDSFVLFTTNGATTFKIANSYDSAVYNFIYPKQAPMPILSAAFVKHQIMKFIAFWNCVEYPQNVNFYIYRSNSVILTLLPVNFSLIGALAVSATFFFFYAWRKHWLFIWFIWSYIATVVLFFIIGRFRMPIVPVMAVFGAGLIVKLMQFKKIYYKRRTGIKKASGLRVASTLILFFVVFALSGPAGIYISPKNWRYNALYSLYGMDLKGYAYALNQNEQEDKASRMLNLCAAETFQGNFPRAEMYIKSLLNAEPDNSYFQRTARELRLIEGIKNKSIPPGRWYSYLKNRPHAHIARFYFALEGVLRKRREFNLPTDAGWVFPDAFFIGIKNGR